MKIEQSYPEEIDQLLSRYCEGAATEEERRKVEDWIGQSDENYRTAKQIFAIYMASDTMNVMGKVDTEKALKRVIAEISVRRRKLWLNRLQRIAAVLFIPALITILMQNITSKQEGIKMVEVRTNPGMTTALELPDGTTVHLNSESSLQYPSRFVGNKRCVKLSGEAFFAVTKNEEQRFIVSTPHQAQVEVLGTKFNVEAFDKDTTVATTLLEGKVRFAYANGNQSESIVMKPGQKLVFDSKHAKAHLYSTTGEAEVAWKDGQIVFLNTPFRQALRMLEKRYNVEFVVSTSRYSNDSFTGTFTNQRLERILLVFEISTHVKWLYIDTDNTSDEKSRIEIY